MLLKVGGASSWRYPARWLPVSTNCVDEPLGRRERVAVGSVAQFEREVMLERQREGIAKAKAEGKFELRSGAMRWPGRGPMARWGDRRGWMTMTGI